MNGVKSIFEEMQSERIQKAQQINEENSEEKEVIEETTQVDEEEEQEVVYEAPRRLTPEQKQALKEECEAKKKNNLNEKCAKNEEDLTKAPSQGLNINKKSTNGRAFTVEINGKKYSYYPTEESGYTAKELGEKYTKIAKYSKGKALAWLKKNATTPDSYRKAKVANEEQEINEEVKITIDANEVLKAAAAIEKAESEGKQVTVVQTSGGSLEVETTEAETDESPEEEPSDDGTDAPEEEKNEACDVATCPKCGKKHKLNEKCCEEEAPEIPEKEDKKEETSSEEAEGPEEKVEEEVDVAELAVRLDECEGSEYMKKALEDGKYNLVKKYLSLKED